MADTADPAGRTFTYLLARQGLNDQNFLQLVREHFAECAPTGCPATTKALQRYVVSWLVRTTGRGSKPRQATLPAREAVVAEYLLTHAGEESVTVRSVANALGLSRAAVARTRAWIEYNQVRAQQTRTCTVRTTYLTDAMLAVLPDRLAADPTDVDEELSHEELLAKLIEEQASDDESTRCWPY